MTLAELIIKISCDSSEAEAGIKKTEEQTGKLGSKFSSITGKIGKAGKVIGTAVASASVAIGKLAFDATKAYAEYEQQVGGVQKLFGDAWQTVVDDAKKAYKTAGVDANTYMQNVTSFSAALIKSVGGDTKKAAEVANRAMKDMSDNANTFGTDIASIQMAYQGFAKENYTMLDNLKLGFGGTKQGAKDLIKEASKLKDIQKKLGVTIDANSMSYENLINAISVYQEYLGISGTTAKEAANTIQGSLGMMKAAWVNLQIALADPEGNVNEAMLNLIDSAKAFAMNAAPVFKNAIKGIGSVIKEFAPVIAKELPGLVNDLLPDLISAGVDLVGGLTQAVIDNAPMLIDGVGQIAQKIGDTLKASDNPIFQAVGEVVSFIGDFIRDPEGTLAKAWESVQDIAAKAWDGIKNTAENVWNAVSDWVNDNIINPVVEWVEKKREDIKAGIEVVKGWVKDKIDAVVQWIEEKRQDISAGIKVVKGWVKDKLKAFVQWVEEKRSQINAGIKVVKGWIKEKFNAVVQWVEEKRQDISDGIDVVKGWIKDKFDATVQWLEEKRKDISDGIDVVKGWIKDKFKAIVTWSSEAVDRISNAISDVERWIAGIPDAVVKFVAGTLQSIKDAIAEIPKVINVAVNFVKNVIEQTGNNLNGLEDYTLGDVTAEEAMAFIKGKSSDSNKGNSNTGRKVITGKDAIKLTPKAKGDWNVPYDDFPAKLHRGEMVLTASQARRYREGENGFDYSSLASTIVGAIREGMQGVQVNSYLDGKRLTDEVSAMLGSQLAARRFV